MNFLYSKSLGMGQHRYVPMKLSVQVQPLDNLSTIGFETAVEVVDGDSRHS